MHKRARTTMRFGRHHPKLSATPNWTVRLLLHNSDVSLVTQTSHRVPVTYYTRQTAAPSKNSPLLPRIKQSPYLFLSCPSTYSSVCSSAKFINPSKQANTPWYVIPELSFTITGRPTILLTKSFGVYAASALFCATSGCAALIF